MVSMSIDDAKNMCVCVFVLHILGDWVDGLSVLTYHVSILAEGGLVARNFRTSSAGFAGTRMSSTSGAFRCVRIDAAHAILLRSPNPSRACRSSMKNASAPSAILNQ